MPRHHILKHESPHLSVHPHVADRRVEAVARSLWNRIDPGRYVPGLTPLHAFFFAMGFVPITCLSIALFGLVPLFVTLPFVVLPMALVTVLVAMRHVDFGRLALLGLLAGMAACGIYDIARLAFVAAGFWGDFIPVIGEQALNDSTASAVWGYVWRFVGNGGAMGMAFAMLPWRSVTAGVVFGVGICLCLFGTLVFSPYAQDILFPLTPLTATTAMIGHLIYGSMLVILLRKWENGRRWRIAAAGDAGRGLALAADERVAADR